MSSIVCLGKLKCRAMKVFACFLIEERWPDSRALTFCFVSPTYCWSHLAQLIRYITLVVEQERSQALITGYRRLVKELRKKWKKRMKGKAWHDMTWHDSSSVWHNLIPSKLSQLRAEANCQWLQRRIRRTSSQLHPKWLLIVKAMCHQDGLNLT